jgi:hypothetical protein
MGARAATSAGEIRRQYAASGSEDDEDGDEGD